LQETKYKMDRNTVKRVAKKILGISLVGTQNEATRLKWLESTLQKIPTGSRILDAGAGELVQKKYCTHLNYVSQDFGQYDGIGDGKGLQTKKWDNSKLDIICDIIAIPEPDSSFDAIMCVEVFEHLPDPISAIKEFSRLLKTNGILVITAPFCSLTHFAPYHFYTGFNRYFYEKHLTENGFDIIEITPNGNYFEYIAQELRSVQFISEKYTDKKTSFIDRMAIRKILKLLNKSSNSDKGSSELLNFGFHILAKKKN
jgi:ubiquinone/menaquinone biosynthesis C-methylase UbiE